MTTNTIWDRTPSNPDGWDVATMGSAVFADTYKGERWRYGSDTVDLQTLPWRWLIGSGRESMLYKFETFATWAQIPDDLVAEWGLELVQYNPARA